MKKLLLALFLISSPVFARPQLPLPLCIKGKLSYVSQAHMTADICINLFKAKSMQDCRDKVRVIALTGDRAIYEKKINLFLNNRLKEICGK